MVLKGTNFLVKFLLLSGLFFGAVSLLALLSWNDAKSARTIALKISDNSHHNDDDNNRPIDAIDKPRGCLGPPYLYITVHDKTANVLQYSRDGCLLSDNVLLFDEADYDPFDVEFRSMAIGKHKDHEVFFFSFLPFMHIFLSSPFIYTPFSLSSYSFSLSHSYALFLSHIPLCLLISNFSQFLRLCS